jgi:hypothetical protein
MHKYVAHHTSLSNVLFVVLALHFIDSTSSFLNPRKHLRSVCHSTATESLEKTYGGIVYRTSVFNKEEYAIIAEDVAQVGTFVAESPQSVAKLRRGAVLPPNSRTVQLFKHGSLRQWVQQMTSPDYELSEQVPVEIRSYEQPGACMAWHSDDLLYRDPPQIEIVWTLENTSDCRTMWKTETGQVQSVETEKNSAILLRAGGPEHCVTNLKRGKRIIIKCVYASKKATFVSQTQDAAQFQAVKTKKRRNVERDCTICFL